MSSKSAPFTSHYPGFLQVNLQRIVTENDQASDQVNLNPALGLVAMKEPDSSTQKYRKVSGS